MYLTFSFAKSGNPTWGPGYMTKAEPIRCSLYFEYNSSDAEKQQHLRIYSASGSGGSDIRCVVMVEGVPVEVAMVQ